MIETFVGALLFAAGVITGWMLSQRERAFLVKAHDRVSDLAEELAGKVAMLKGLHPHFADPKRFVPEGPSRQDWKERTEPVEAPGLDNPEGDEDDREEFEASLERLNLDRKKARANVTG